MYSGATLFHRHKLKTECTVRTYLYQLLFLYSKYRASDMRASTICKNYWTWSSYHTVCI